MGNKPWEKYQAQAAVQQPASSTEAPATAQKPWEKYQAPASNAAEAQTSAPAPAKKELGFIDKAQAALEGFGQGGTLGYLPEAQAAFGSAVENANELLGGQPATPYDELRDFFKKRDSRLAQESPLTYGAGNIAGAVATLPVGGAPAKGASFLARAAKAGKVAALYGGLANPTSAENPDDYLALGERLKKATESGLIGGLTGGILSNTGPALEKSGRKLSDQAVVKQMGANAGQIKKILQKGELPKIGGFLSREGLMMPGQTLDDVAEKSGAILKEDGPKIGKLYSEAQEQAAAQGASKYKIDGNKLADKIVNDAKAAAKNHPDRNAVQKTIEDAVAPLRDMGEDANILDLHDFRKGLDENINWGQRAQERDAVQRTLVNARNAVVDETKGAINKLDEVTGGKQLSELKALNDRYSTASTVSNVSTQGVARETAKAFMGHGVIGAGAGIGGATLEFRRSHDPLKALGVGIASALALTGARKFGAPVGYYGGKAAEGLGQGLTAVTPRPGAIGLGAVSPWLMMEGKNGR